MLASSLTWVMKAVMPFASFTWPITRKPTEKPAHGHQEESKRPHRLGVVVR